MESQRTKLLSVSDGAIARQYIYSLIDLWMIAVIIPHSQILRLNPAQASVYFDIILLALLAYHCAKLGLSFLGNFQ